MKYSAQKQLLMPGTEEDIGGLLKLQAAKPIQPRKPQKACDIGLFSDDAAQTDLVLKAAA